MPPKHQIPQHLLLRRVGGVQMDPTVTAELMIRPQAVIPAPRGRNQIEFMQQFVPFASAAAPAVVNTSTIPRQTGLRQNSTVMPAGTLGMPATSDVDLLGGGSSVVESEVVRATPVRDVVAGMAEETRTPAASERSYGRPSEFETPRTSRASSVVSEGGFAPLRFAPRMDLPIGNRNPSILSSPVPLVIFNPTTRMLEPFSR